MRAADTRWHGMLAVDPRPALLLLGALALPAGAQDATQHGAGARCIQGDCNNGTGTIRHEDGNEYTGAWSGGRFIDGTYRVRYPFEASRTSELSFNAQGQPVAGTLLRGNPYGVPTGTVGSFTGTFRSNFNPILNRTISTYHQGRYTDQIGRIYDGEFSYLPVHKPGLPSGSFIFQGVRIDDEADEVIRGLFISDPAATGFPIQFRRARPDYLVKLQQDFESDKVQAATDARAAAQAAEDARQSSSNMGAVLGIMGGLLAIGGAGGRLGGLQSSALSTLSGGISGRQSSSAILSGVLSQVVRQATSDPALAGQIGDTSNPANIISALTSLGGRGSSMTRSQYAAQLLASAGAGSGGSGSAMVDAMGQAVINRTQNTITSALGGSSSGARTAVSLLQAAVAAGTQPPPPAVTAPSATATPPMRAGATLATASADGAERRPGYGTVLLHLTPGKGLLDPVTGQFVRQLDQLSCDNVTTAGHKLRDLPAGQRGCADAAGATRLQ